MIVIPYSRAQSSPKASEAENTETKEEEEEGGCTSEGGGGQGGCSSPRSSV